MTDRDDGAASKRGVQSASEKNAKIHAPRARLGGGDSTRTERVARGWLRVALEREVAKEKRRHETRRGEMR